MTLRGRLVDEIDQALNAKAWTQGMLAARAGISEKHLSQLMCGRVGGSFDVWDKLAAAVGCEWDVELVVC